MQYTKTRRKKLECRFEALYGRYFRGRRHRLRFEVGLASNMYQQESDTNRVARVLLFHSFLAVSRRPADVQAGKSFGLACNPNDPLYILPGAPPVKRGCQGMLLVPIRCLLCMCSLQKCATLRDAVVLCGQAARRSPNATCMTGATDFAAGRDESANRMNPRAVPGFGWGNKYQWHSRGNKRIMVVFLLCLRVGARSGIRRFHLRPGSITEPCLHSSSCSCQGLTPSQIPGPAIC